MIAFDCLAVDPSGMIASDSLAVDPSGMIDPLMSHVASRWIPLV